MKSVKSRLLIGALSVLVAAGAMSGCGKKEAANTSFEYVADSNLNEPGVFPVCKEPITLTVGIPKQELITDYVNNSYTKALEEKMNCKLKFVYLPASESAQKVELMVSAGGSELPDIIVGVYFSDKALLTYGKGGYIIPLDEYYEKSSYYTKQMLEKETGLETIMTSADGHMYYIPNYCKSLQNEYGTRLFVYKPWLDKLGLKTPETLDDFKNMLMKFKNSDPNGNNKNDELPYIGAKENYPHRFIDFIMSSYLPVSPEMDYLYNDDGKIKAAYTQKEWKEGLKYLNDLYDNGLIPASSFTMDESQFKQLINNVDTTIVGSYVAMSAQISDMNDPRYKEYQIVAPLKGPDGVARSIYQPCVPTASFVISKNCKHPEAAFRLGDLMCSEEMTIHARWGEKGVDWVEPEENEKGFFEDMGYPAVIKPIMQWGSPSSSHWFNAGAGYRDYNVAAGMVASEKNYFEKIIAESIPGYLKTSPKEEIITKLIYNAEELDTVSDIQSTIDSYLTDMTARFITGDVDIDSGWDNYIKQLEKIGVNDLIKASQNAYDRMYADK